MLYSISLFFCVHFQLHSTIICVMKYSWVCLHLVYTTALPSSSLLSSDNTDMSTHVFFPPLILVCHSSLHIAACQLFLLSCPSSLSLLSPSMIDGPSFLHSARWSTLNDCKRCGDWRWQPFCEMVRASDDRSNWLQEMTQRKGFSPGQHSFVSTTSSLSVLVTFPPAHHWCHDHDADNNDRPSLTVPASIETRSYWKVIVMLMNNDICNTMLVSPPSFSAASFSMAARLTLKMLVDGDK